MVAMMRSRQRARGVGAFTVIVFILFAVLVANFFLTVGKDYLQYFTVRSVVSDVAAAPGAAERTDRQLWSEIDRRFSINSIYELKAPEVISFAEDGWRALTCCSSTRCGVTSLRTSTWSPSSIVATSSRLDACGRPCPGLPRVRVDRG
jgi:hypothetical protein